MTHITDIRSTFFRCAETTGRKSNNVTVIPSKWIVTFSNGSIKTYHITLSHETLDPKCPSGKIPNYDPENFYMQIDSNPKTFSELFKEAPSEESLKKIENDPDPKHYILCPKWHKGRPLYFYPISPLNFVPISIKDVLKKIDGINNLYQSVNPLTEERVKRLDLFEDEAKVLFYHLFETHLLAYIRKNNPDIDDRRKPKAERTPLLSNADASTDSIIDVFRKIFCCCC